jgi:hypothetical protein
MILRRPWAIAILTASSIACGSSARNAAPDGSIPTDDGGQPDYGYGEEYAAVQAILATDCVVCHDPAHPVVPETETYAALDLTAGGAYSALVGRPATQACGGTLVVPGDPAASYLYRKVVDDTPCEGQRMPHVSTIYRGPLSDAQIATFESWIRDGALP